MRFALAAEGSRGDVQPLVGLAARLVEHGHQAAVCAPPDLRHLVEERGLEFRPLGTDIHSLLAENADTLHRGAVVWALQSKRVFQRVMGEQFEALPRAAAGADMIIGGGVQFAGPSVSEAWGIPYLPVAYCPALLRSADYPPAVVPNQSLPRWVNLLAWGGFLRLQDHLLRRDLDRHRSALGLGPVTDTYRYLTTERILLATDEALAPAPDDAPVQVDQVGYLLPADETPLPPKLESFLQAGPPPVYLGFGSMMDSDPAGTTRLLVEAVERAGCRAILSRGWAGLGDGPLPDFVFGAGSLPHANLFSKVAAVVHHGGAGTTTTAARSGAPQIVIPHLLDQHYWGHRTHLLGVSPPPLPRTKLSAARLAGLISACLENELLSERARELAEKLCTGDPLERAVESILASRVGGLD
jgi:UDP:flavonoid glycosyltransferase YjiC (YdhE family)